MLDYLKTRPALAKAVASRIQDRQAAALVQAEEERLQSEKEFKDFCEVFKSQVSGEIIVELGLKFGLGDDGDPIAYSGNTPACPPSSGDWVIGMERSSLCDASKKSWSVSVGVAHGYFEKYASIDYSDNDCSPLLSAIIDLLENKGNLILHI